jgi:hypothetical protein
MQAIKPGDWVQVRAADGRWFRRRATTGVVAGDDFPVVWVCREEDWLTGESDQRPPNALPWPETDVKTGGTADNAH